MQNETYSPIAFSELGQRVADPVISQLMHKALQIEGILSLAAGFTDNKTLPDAELADILAELRQKHPGKEYLQYGTTHGRPLLRSKIIELLSSYPSEQLGDYDLSNVLITNGSQQALYLTMQALCNPGDIVLVERPSYFVFLEMLKGLGINALSIPTNDEGEIDFAELEALLEKLKRNGSVSRLKAVYLVSYFSNPSSRCLPEESKRQLGTLFKKAEVTPVFIEDAAYRELYFDAPYPAPSILSLPEFANLPTIYMGTFTKPFATGLKVGFCVSKHTGLLAALYSIKGHQDFGTANCNQAIIENVLNAGQYPHFLSKLRPHYKAKMEILHDTLTEAGLQDIGWRWDIPEGGLLMWLRAPHHLDTGMESDFCEACLEQKVLYVPGELCFGDYPATNFIRLSFGALPSDLLIVAAQRFASVARQFAITT